MNKIKFRNKVTAQYFEHGVLLKEFEFYNDVVNEGANYLLATGFDDGAKFTTWYIGLVDNAGFSAYAAGDSYAEIAGTNGWAEFEDYTDENNSSSAVTRPTWSSVSVSNRIATSATQLIYAFTASGTLDGIFVVAGANAQTKGDTTNTGNVLWATAPFPTGDLAVSNGGELRLLYSIEI